VNSSRGSRSSVVSSVTARAWNPAAPIRRSQVLRGTAPAGASRARRGPRRRAPEQERVLGHGPGIGRIGIPCRFQVARPAAAGAVNAVCEHEQAQ